MQMRLEIHVHEKPLTFYFFLLFLAAIFQTYLLLKVAAGPFTHHTKQFILLVCKYVKIYVRQPLTLYLLIDCFLFSAINFKTYLLCAGHSWTFNTPHHAVTSEANSVIYQLISSKC